MNQAQHSPWVFPITMTPPSLKDNTADVDRLVNAIKQKTDNAWVTIDFPLVKKLPELLRQFNYRVSGVLFKDRGGYILLDVIGQEDDLPVCGLAVDLGTTRIVVQLVHLGTGETLLESSFNNPQIAIGPDILARIHYADEKGCVDELQTLVVDVLNDEISKICKSCGVSTDSIYAVSVAGNTAMTHLFLGLNPHWIIREPYIPVTNAMPVLKTEELGIDVHPNARMIVFPNIGSYFGGDLIAGILYSGIHQGEETTLLVDVGTNAEVLLGNSHWLIACAGAAGPALEGGVTRMGMLAGPGVIDRVTINPETKQIDVHTIDDELPKGICGSGVIDLAAQLFAAGMIDERGKLIPSGDDRLRTIDEMRHLVIVPKEMSATGFDLTLSQADLDSLIRSKAAMYTILNTIAESVGATLGDIDTFYVAGTFGSFINPESAITIGMIPDLPREKFKPLGNSSLGGAARALLDNAGFEEIDAIRDRITYLELNVNQEFMMQFSAAKFIPHTNRSLFPSVS